MPRRRAFCAGMPGQIPPNGYQAQVYGRAAAGEVSWLLAQAKSHAAAPDDRRLLEPLAELAAKKRTPREISGCV